jgi:ATP-binding cassette subfamily F protein 3
MISDQARVGLVGDNGAGKTTLLRILAGKIEPDGGRVEYDRGVTAGYLPQDLVELGSGSVMEFLRDVSGISSLQRGLSEAEGRISELGEGTRELASALARHEELERAYSHCGGYEFEPTAKKVLRGLGFAPGDTNRPCGEFSGGWRMRIALAAILMQRPRLMLLDEPTNHLDTESMEWLEGWLRDHRGAMVFVSHDRRFLSRMATEIADLSDGAITHYSMGYERYLAEKEEARARLEQNIENQKERIDRIRHFVERFRYKASKASQVQSRIKQLEKMEAYEAPQQGKSVRIKFPEAPRSGYEAVSAQNISKSYGGIEVFSNVSLEIHRGERVALVGVNGAGKSTLMRLISGTEAPDSGSVKFGHNVKRAYFSQESAQNLDYSHTLWEEVTRAGSDMTEAARRNLLGAFLFSGDDIRKPISVLSGGEKSRVALFKLLLSDSNLMILDEPTNHLDMNTREIFQKALLEYGGTLFIVSHDRFFLDSLAERVFELRDGKIYNYPGNYSQFIERRDALSASGGIPGSARLEKTDARKKRRLESEDRNRLYRERRVFAGEVEAIEGKISAYESRRDEIDAMLCDPQTLSNSKKVQSLMLERKDIEESLKSSCERWEELSLALERIK